MKNQRVIITGSRGRISSLIRPALLRPERDLKLYSRTAGDGHRNILELLMPDAIHDRDTILHLAWSTVPVCSENNIGQEEKHDLPLLKNLLENIAKLPNPESAHFIFLSTGAIYGSAAERASREEDAHNPCGWYARYKLAAEQEIQEFSKRLGISFAILRVSNIYGITTVDGPPQGIVPLLIDSNRRKVTIWGDGSARKDYLHSIDLTSAIEQVIEQKLVGIMNLSYGESHSVLELIGKVEELLDRKITVEYLPAKTWDVKDNRLDSSYFQETSGWTPRISLEEGILQTLNEMRSYQLKVA